MLRLGLLAVSVAWLAVAAAAHAELGGPLASVATDGARLGATTASVSAGASVGASPGAYTRHDLTRANHGMVHEFTNAGGQVFAVTWQGPGKPDLRQLLGSYFTALQGGATGIGRAMHALRRPAQVNRSDLQIQTGGHMGWFHGIAFLPALAPAGFATADLAPTP